VDANGSTGDVTFHLQVVNEADRAADLADAGSGGVGDDDLRVRAERGVSGVGGAFPCGPGIEQSDGSWQATFDTSSCFGNGSNRAYASVTWTNGFRWFGLLVIAVGQLRGVESDHDLGVYG